MTTESDIAEFNRKLNDGARLLHQNRPGEALEILKPLLEVESGHPDLAINIGSAYILQRKWRDAVVVLSRAADAHPDNVMILTNLGAAHLGRLETAGPKQQERAIRAYEKALQVDPKAPNIHYHLGLIYHDRGELHRSAAFFQRALEVNPADRDAQNWLDRFAAQDDDEQTLPDSDQRADQPEAPSAASEDQDRGEDA